MSKWELSIGTFPGLVVGLRTYQSETKNDHVLYLGFIDICLTIFND